MTFGQVLTVLSLGVGLDVVGFLLLWARVLRVERTQRRILGILMVNVNGWPPGTMNKSTEGDDSK